MPSCSGPERFSFRWRGVRSGSDSGVHAEKFGFLIRRVVGITACSFRNVDIPGLGAEDKEDHNMTSTNPHAKNPCSKGQGQVLIHFKCNSGQGQKAHAQNRLI